MTTDFADLMVVRRERDHRFHADPAGRGFLFGGLTMGLALTAAAETVADGLIPMTLRCNFLSFGEWGPTDLDVEDVSTSRSFAIRRVELRQGAHAELVAVADATFHQPEPGADEHDPFDASVAPPDETEPVSVRFGSRVAVDPFEVRAVDAHRFRLGERLHPYWARTREPLPDDVVSHCAALTFMSDYLVIHSPFEPGSGQGEGLRSFTLEHTLWFHRAFEASRWMLFDCMPLTQSHGRYLSRGTVHDETGLLLASFAQVGFIRPRRD
jgi:acyl-CoA thioesterase II